MSPLGLRVEAPMVSLRNPYAREYAETFRVPPPSTVYGMLLSMVGEERRLRHAGVRLAIAVLDPEPTVSTVLRTVWRVKDLKAGPGVGENRRMDFQQLLVDLRFAVWVDSDAESEANHTLAERLQTALTRPNEVTRFGGLSLGESRDMVDVVALLRDVEVEATWLIPDAQGRLSLPIWPDHVAGGGTRWGSFRSERRRLERPPPSEFFVAIDPP